MSSTPTIGQLKREHEAFAADLKFARADITRLVEENLKMGRRITEHLARIAELELQLTAAQDEAEHLRDEEGRCRVVLLQCTTRIKELEANARVGNQEAWLKQYEDKAR